MVKSIFYPLFVAVLLVALIEFILVYWGGYNEITIGDTNCSYVVKESNFSHYRSNCNLFHKNWEQDEGVWYHFNQDGRRGAERINSVKQIAFVGDSFTLGAMVSEKNTIISYLNAKKKYQTYAFHNYGVGGEQFHNLHAKLNTFDFGSYEKIILGITPNDFFNIVDGSDPAFYSNPQRVAKENKISSSVQKISTFLLNLSVTRALLYHFLSIDRFYMQIYEARKPYSGYLSDPMSPKFKDALEHMGEKISSLNPSVKSKLVIFLLPQRAQVVSFRLGRHSESFYREFDLMCKKHNLKCGFPSILKLSKIPDNSHYVVDGHMKPSGNAMVASDLYNFLYELD